MLDRVKQGLWIREGAAAAVTTAIAKVPTTLTMQ